MDDIRVMRVSMTYPTESRPGVGLPTYYESLYSGHKEMILTSKLEGKKIHLRKGVQVVEHDIQISQMAHYNDNYAKRIVLFINKIREQFLFLLKSKAYIKDFKPDIIHISSPIPLMCGIYAKKKCKSKIVMSLHGSDTLRLSKVKIFRNLLRIPDAIVAVSDEMEKMFPSYYMKKPIVYIGNGVDLQTFKNLGKERKKQFIHVANLRWQKGQEFLIEGFYNFYKNHRDYELIIIGEGEEKEKLLELCVKYGLSKAVKFQGTKGREYIATELNNSCAFVLTSVSEGFPKVIIEAMATGTPVLSSDVGNVANVVRDSGIIFPVKDSNAVAKAMEEIVSSKDVWQVLSEKAEQYSKQYSWENHSNKLNKVYNDLLKEKEMNIKEKQQKLVDLMEVFDKICTNNSISYTLGFGSALGAIRHHGFIPWDADIDVIVSIKDIYKLREVMSKELPESIRWIEWDKEKRYHPGFDRLIYREYPHELIHVDVFYLCGAPVGQKDNLKFRSNSWKTYRLLSCRTKIAKYSNPNHRWMVKILNIVLRLIPENVIKQIYKSYIYRYDYDKSVNTFIMCTKSRVKEPSNKRILEDTIRVPFETLSLPVPREYDMYLTDLYGDYMTPKEY